MKDTDLDMKGFEKTKEFQDKFVDKVDPFG